MWGGENSVYVSLSGTQNRLTHVVAVWTGCDSEIVVDDMRFRGLPHPAPHGDYCSESDKFVRRSLREVARKAASHCDPATEDTVYDILLSAFREQMALG